ncbi:hypothetical protein DL767_006488 [Monosporascus sp. MG133]|nr:hypothetical protein DL767_006488 [Monosporascus sp. MG133]
MPDPYLLVVDAACINQNYDEEKRVQRRCAGVLGTAFASTFGHGLYDIVDGFPRGDEERDKVRELIGQIDMGPTNWHDVPLPAVEALFERPFWYRVWTLREVVLAKDALIVCGSREAPWTSIVPSAAVFILKAMLGEPILLSRQLDRIVRVMVDGGSDDDSLSRNLYVIKGSRQQWTDLRDYVYGILGLVDQEIASRIPVI